MKDKILKTKQKTRLTFSEKRKKLAEKKKKVNKRHLKGGKPPDVEVNNLLQQYQNGKYSDAEKLAVSLAARFPKHPLPWKVLGAVLVQTGRFSEAMNPNQMAVELAPLDAGPRNNLGAVYKELGRFEEAEACYRQAIALKSDAGEVHYNLGAVLQESGRFNEAEASYNQAIALKPDYAEAHSNLGVTLKQLGRVDEALSAYVQALTLNPGLIKATVNLGLAITDTTFNSSNSALYPMLINLLSEGNFVRPRDVASSISSLLKHDPLIEQLLAKKNIVKNIKEITSAIETLDKLPLLHHLMRLSSLPDLELEGLFSSIRRLLLRNLDQLEKTSATVYFLSTLSLHCFTNEYVYFESDDEIQQIDDLELKIKEILEQEKQPEILDVLCFATYRPLHCYDWCEQLAVLDRLRELKERLIEQPLSEAAMMAGIPVLGVISDEVSLRVRQQYEENPYPRWTKLSIPLKKMSIVEFCDEIDLRLYSENIEEVSAPEILVAGCGTGQHSIGTATRFSDCQVTAVDLSLSSLAYAQRKSNELGLENLNYLQADILDLHRLGREFDLIQSSGVLHHMDDPMAGWKVLCDLLKPGGLLKIGLYSELARGHIIKIREEIVSLALGTSESEIRQFRLALVESKNTGHLQLTSLGDFFSLSELRDLIFHVQEHRFTIPQLQECLDELGLKFCGFENKKAIVSEFREFHGQESDIYDLALWHQFEESNPSTFIGMYQFYCQRL